MGDFYLQSAAAKCRITAFELGICRFQVVLDANHGRVVTACIVCHNYGDQHYFVPVFSFAFVPSIFPCCFVPCCSCRFFRFLFGSLFLIDTSGNQAGYVLKVYWLVSTLLWVATKEVTLSASSLLTKKDSMSFWRTSRTVCGALMLNLYS